MHVYFAQFASQRTEWYILSLFMKTIWNVMNGNKCLKEKDIHVIFLKGTQVMTCQLHYINVCPFHKVNCFFNSTEQYFLSFLRSLYVEFSLRIQTTFSSPTFDVIVVYKVINKIVISFIMYNEPGRIFIRKYSASLRINGYANETIN